MAISASQLDRWNGALSEAITSLDNADFPDLFVEAMRQLLEFDHCLVYKYPLQGQATSLYHNMNAETGRLITEVYLAGPYLLDPFYGAVLKGKKEGFGAIRSLAPDQFYRSEFYRYHYVNTGIADEIGLFFPVSDHEVAVLSITRQRPKKYFTELERQHFAALNPVVQKFARRYWATGENRNRNKNSNNPISTVFEYFGQSVLTAREKEIVELILKGHSSVSVGHVLGISTGTVKIHRKNAYEKLQISSQAELFSMFLDSLSKQLGQ